MPTPLFFRGASPLVEGEPGFASVRITGADNEFARWLERRGLGELRPGGVTVVLSPTPVGSLERAAAWAQAFARVLMLNGLAVTVEEHIQ